MKGTKDIILGEQKEQNQKHAMTHNNGNHGCLILSECKVSERYENREQTE